MCRVNTHLPTSFLLLFTTIHVKNHIVCWNATPPDNLIISNELHTSKDGAELLPAGDATLGGELTQGNLQEEDW